MQSLEGVEKHNMVVFCPLVGWSGPSPFCRELINGHSDELAGLINYSSGVMYPPTQTTFPGFMINLLTV